MVNKCVTRISRSNYFTPTYFRFDVVDIILTGVEFRSNAKFQLNRRTVQLLDTVL